MSDGPAIPAFRGMSENLRWMAVALALLFSMLLPIVHYDLERNFHAGTLATLSELTAHEIMEKVIARDPDYWVYAGDRLSAILREHLMDRSIRQTVYGMDGLPLATVGSCPGFPCLKQRTDLLDAGVPVGVLETHVSMHGLLVESLIYALELAVISILLIVVFTLFPLRRMREAERTIQYLAHHDSLTGLYNRYVAEQLFGQEMKRAQRYRLQLSLILFDIDHFKIINDLHGHGVGDEILRQLASLISANIRSSDYLARWGGEEFLIITTHTDFSMARQLAEKLRTLVEQHDFGIGEPVTISLGVSQCCANSPLSECVNRADIAMYQAKHWGRNRCVEAPMNTDVELPPQRLGHSS